MCLCDYVKYFCLSHMCLCVCILCLCLVCNCFVCICFLRLCLFLSIPKSLNTRTSCDSCLPFSLILFLLIIYPSILSLHVPMYTIFLRQQVQCECIYFFSFQCYEPSTSFYLFYPIYFSAVSPIYFFCPILVVGFHNKKVFL